MEDRKAIAIKKVMVALDLSRYSESTFLYAQAIARPQGAELILVNVINTRFLDSVHMVGGEGYGVDPKEIIASTYKERQQALEEQFLAKAPEATARIVLRSGLPWEQIIQAVREEKPDLLVIGAKGRGDAAGVLFGSVAEKVQRHCPCPILSVRGEEHCRLPLAAGG